MPPVFNRSVSNSGDAPSGSAPPDRTTEECQPDCKLVGLSVVSHAEKVGGDKNWAAVKKAAGYVVVEATVTPGNKACRESIVWSGDAGEPVPNRPHQRRLSRAVSMKYHVEAELGGVSDHVDVWILWGTVTILTSGTTPPNAVQNGKKENDKTENLGAVIFQKGKTAAGKIIAVAEITPPGVHKVVKRGWTFRREIMNRDWIDGVKDEEFWNASWFDDTSLAWQTDRPDEEDKLYDNDSPNHPKHGRAKNAETYNNFRQWIEWNDEVCSDKAGWYFRCRWEKSATPQITFVEVGAGNIELPKKPFYHP